MQRRELKLELMRSASAAVVVPIAGMLGGLIIGGYRASGAGLDEISQLARVIKWVVTGFFTGLGLVVLLAIQLRRRDLISIRRLMILVAIAAIVGWFFARVLFNAIGQEGF